jgi:TPR repeat protein
MRISMMIAAGTAVLAAAPATAAPPKEDIALVRAKAANGDAAAMVALGNDYQYGQGIGRDPAEALRWYRAAAAKGNAAAMEQLGQMYATGDGVTLDDAEAFRWYEAAAKGGDALGMLSLGQAYTSGQGVAQDSAAAVRWFGHRPRAARLSRCQNWRRPTLMAGAFPRMRPKLCGGCARPPRLAIRTPNMS